MWNNQRHQMNETHERTKKIMEIIPCELWIKCIGIHTYIIFDFFRHMRTERNGQNAQKTTNKKMGICFCVKFKLEIWLGAVDDDVAAANEFREIKVWNNKCLINALTSNDDVHISRPQIVFWFFDCRLSTFDSILFFLFDTKIGK